MDISDSSYQQICSARTVQSDQKGFFNEFFLEVKGGCSEKWLKHYFSQLKSNEARILSIFSDQEICDTVLGVLENVAPVYKLKDGLFSVQRRAQADKFNLLGDFEQALMHANLAVMRAPAKDVERDIDNGLSLAMAYRSRAGILINLGYGEAALRDLKLAASYGLELKGNVDYYIKMAKAYALMGESARSDISLKVAEKLSGNNISLRDSFDTELALIRRSETSDQPVVPTLTNGENHALRGASSLVKVVETKERGRFVVAGDNLKTGDVVLCENPVAACLSPTFAGSHCHHCFQRIFSSSLHASFRLTTPVPCLNCSGIAFCSPQCMGEACDSYHRFECQFMDLFIGSGMSILCYLALRVFTQAPSLENALHDATSMYENLCSHIESREAEDYLQRSLMAGFLLRCLQKAQYFGRRKSEGVNPTAVELKVGTALLGLLQVLQYNAHEVFEKKVTDQHRFEGSKIVYVGAAIYASGAYFNHECWPSVARYFVGKKLVLTTIKPHQPNEIIAENYGPIFTKTNLKERQRSLRARYLFECKCKACQENWPTIQKIEKQVRFRCPSANCVNVLKFPKDIAKEVRCSRCRKNVSLKASVAKMIQIEELYRRAAESMHNQKVQEAIDQFTEGIEAFFEIAVLPHKDTIIAQHSLIRCFADRGTTFK
ncbi:PREDICTED: SET and MYND domain-containing protein 4 isoform X1 [Rhagoletis zephyria]|uniref:SET and MYND domain-containing protein 4 isoform X1 n=1 Tax=Rhagoletis zephyria TaxID=28612 RepID=UPI0008115331|nr:PREDICTED: SET and MYND domain-containing protein 4 isoform X1 [Rhagoletis zephyria]